MSVNSKTVAGRRTLRFNSLDELIAEAERLVASPATRMLGNWPLGQLLSHLTRAMNASIDGISFRAPWHLRLFGLVMKQRMLERGLPAGIKLPKEAEAAAFPAVASPQEALDILRRAVGRLQTERATSNHPVLGKMTHDQWTQLHLRHAELHLSYAVP